MWIVKLCFKLSQLSWNVFVCQKITDHGHILKRICVVVFVLLFCFFFKGLILFVFPQSQSPALRPTRTIATNSRPYLTGINQKLLHQQPFLWTLCLQPTFTDKTSGAFLFLFALFFFSSSLEQLWEEGGWGHCCLWRKNKQNNNKQMNFGSI